MDEGIFSFFLDNFGIKTVVFVMATYALYLLITNLPKIMESITYFQSRKIKHITEALNSEWVNDDYKKILKKDISRLYLSGTLKIKANEKQVKEIIKIIDVMKGSCSTKEVYSAIKNLPNEFYNFSLNVLKKEKTKQERKMEYEIIVLILAVLVLPSLHIVYVYILAEHRNYQWGWTVKNFIVVLFPVPAMFLKIIDFAIFKKKNTNVIKVLNGVISSKEDG